MAVDVLPNMTEVVTNTNWSAVLSRIPGFESLVKLGLAVGILLVVYIAFLIIRSIVQIISSRRFKRLTKNVEEINAKMDILISKIDKKKK